MMNTQKRILLSTALLAGFELHAMEMTKWVLEKGIKPAARFMAPYVERYAVPALPITAAWAGVGYVYTSMKLRCMGGAIEKLSDNIGMLNTKVDGVGSKVDGIEKFLSGFQKTTDENFENLRKHCSELAQSIVEQNEETRSVLLAKIAKEIGPIAILLDSQGLLITNNHQELLALIQKNIDQLQTNSDRVQKNNELISVLLLMLSQEKNISNSLREALQRGTNVPKSSKVMKFLFPEKSTASRFSSTALTLLRSYRSYEGVLLHETPLKKLGCA